MAADWDLKEMTMWKIIPTDNHKQIQVYFPVNTWIGKKESTFKAKRETYPSTDHHPRGIVFFSLLEYNLFFSFDDLQDLHVIIYQLKLVQQ